MKETIQLKIILVKEVVFLYIFLFYLREGVELVDRGVKFVSCIIYFVGRTLTF